MTIKRIETVAVNYSAYTNKVKKLATKTAREYEQILDKKPEYINDFIQVFYAEMRKELGEDDFPVMI